MPKSLAIGNTQAAHQPRTVCKTFLDLRSMTLRSSMPTSLAIGDTEAAHQPVCKTFLIPRSMPKSLAIGDTQTGHESHTVFKTFSQSTRAQIRTATKPSRKKMHEAAPIAA